MKSQYKIITTDDPDILGSSIDIMMKDKRINIKHMRIITSQVEVSMTPDFIIHALTVLDGALTPVTEASFELASRGSVRTAPRRSVAR